MGHSPIIPLYPIPPAVPSDAFLCSYPKSGRTWVRQFLAQYLRLAYDLEYIPHYDLQKLMTIVPAEWWLVNSPKSFKFAGKIPRIRCAHFLPDERFRGHRIVRLQRGIEDTLVSLYHHVARSVPIGQFVRARVHEAVYYYKAWDQPASWGETSNTGLVVKYEDLRADSPYWFDRIVKHLRLVEDRGALRKAIELSSFTKMLSDQSGTKEKRVRRGKIGGFVDELSGEDIAYIQRIVNGAGL